VEIIFTLLSILALGNLRFKNRSLNWIWISEIKIEKKITDGKPYLGRIFPWPIFIFSPALARCYSPRALPLWQTLAASRLPCASARWAQGRQPHSPPRAPGLAAATVGPTS
jgi:hypothetical protein